MERKIGEIFEYKGEWYQCLESNNCRCDYCELDGVVDCCKIACTSSERIDNKSVYFKKLEKVGELYNDCGTILQRFKIYTNVTNADTKGLELHIYSNDTIGIEIKQIKEDIEEDMKEKKLNLKPFDLQKAKEGKHVCTRDGRSARIVCFDAKCGKSPIIALIENGKNEEVHKFYKDGKLFGLDEDEESFKDLMIMPEKRSGWVNVYKGSVCISVYPRIYKSME